MRKPVEAVDAQIQAWRLSSADALRRMDECSSAFEESARAIEEQMDAFALAAAARLIPDPPEEKTWRWNRRGYVLFWIAALLLCALSFAAGYLAAFSA